MRWVRACDCVSLSLSLRLYLNNQLRAHSLFVFGYFILIDLVMFDFAAIFAACLFAEAFFGYSASAGVLY